MRTVIYQVYKKSTIKDPNYARELGREQFTHDPDTGDEVEIDGWDQIDCYAYVFSTTDEIHARFVVGSDEDSTYIFTGEQGFSGILN